LRRKLTRDRFLKLFGEMPPCIVGLEAGSGAHHWARELAKLGHDVRLMPPQFVKPYVKTNKNDAADAEACCEAVQRPGMRFVPTKTIEQQAAMALHRVRDHLISRRTATINALRGHLAEYGVVAQVQRTGLRQLFDLVLDDQDQSLDPTLKPVLRMLVDEIVSMDARISDLDRRVKDAARDSEACRRLVEIPGIGSQQRSRPRSLMKRVSVPGDISLPGSG